MDVVVVVRAGRVEVIPMARRRPFRDDDDDVGMACGDASIHFAPCDTSFRVLLPGKGAVS
jgi:hypothetical protein